MYLRDYLHDMPLKALKAIALRLEVEVEYEARIKLVNAVDMAFWDGTLARRLLKGLSGNHHRLLSTIAFSYDSGTSSKNLQKKFEKITGATRQETRRLLEDLIGYALVGALQRDEVFYFCPRGVAEHVRAVFLKNIACFPDEPHAVPAAAPPHLLEDTASLLAVIHKEKVPLTLMGRIRKATLDRAFSGSPTCTGPHPMPQDFRNGFVCDYLKQRELVSFGNRQAAVTPRLESWLALSMTERFRDMVSFALRHILHDVHTITALTGMLGEIRAGTGFELIKLGYFLHADTMAPSGFSRIESRLRHFLDVLTKLGLTAFIDERYVLTNTGEALFRGNQHPLDENVSTSFMTQPNFEIILGPEIDMQVRFTLEILAERRNRDMVLTYEVTRDGIARARERGMSTEDIMAFFTEHTRNAIPQNVQFSIESWAKSYGSIYFEDTVLMRFRDASTCGSVLHIPEMAPYIIEQLSDTALTVSARHVPQITAIIKKAGYHPEPYGISEEQTTESAGDFVPESPELLLSENAIPLVQNKYIFPENFLSNGDET